MSVRWPGQRPVPGATKTCFSVSEEIRWYEGSAKPVCLPGKGGVPSGT